MRSALVWDVTERRIVLVFDVSGQPANTFFNDRWLPETSVTNCQFTLCNVTDERRSELFNVIQCRIIYVHMTVHRNKLLFNEINRRTLFQIYSCTKLYMFRAVPVPIIRS